MAWLVWLTLKFYLSKESKVDMWGLGIVQGDRIVGPLGWGASWECSEEEGPESMEEVQLLDGRV